MRNATQTAHFLVVPPKRPSPARRTNMLTLLAASSGFVAQPRAFAPRVSTRHPATCLGASDNFYGFTAKELVTNKDMPLSQYEGKVSLVVNVASR